MEKQGGENNYKRNKEMTNTGCQAVGCRFDGSVLGFWLTSFCLDNFLEVFDR